MILLVLNYLKVWSNDSSLRGINQESDSVVVVKLELIRQANAKLIERNYLLQINKEQDSIISYKNDYIKEQYKVIDTLQNKIGKYQYLTNDLNTELKDKRKKIITYSISCAVVGIIVGLLIN